MSQEDQVPVVGGEALLFVGTDADLNVASLGAVGDRHLVDMYDRQPPQCGCGAAVMISSLL